jgi:hypothetical protein
MSFSYIRAIRIDEGAHAMTASAIVRKTDLIRAARVSNQTGCKIEIKSGGVVITVYPEDKAAPQDPCTGGIDYSRPIL